MADPATGDVQPSASPTPSLPASAGMPSAPTTPTPDSAPADDFESFYTSIPEHHRKRIEDERNKHAQRVIAERDKRLKVEQEARQRAEAEQTYFKTLDSFYSLQDAHSRETDWDKKEQLAEQIKTLSRQLLDPAFETAKRQRIMGDPVIQKELSERAVYAVMQGIRKDDRWSDVPAEVWDKAEQAQTVAEYTRILADHVSEKALSKLKPDLIEAGMAEGRRQANGEKRNPDLSRGEAPPGRRTPLSIEQIRSMDPNTYEQHRAGILEAAKTLSFRPSAARGR